MPGLGLGVFPLNEGELKAARVGTFCGFFSVGSVFQCAQKGVRAKHHAGGHACHAGDFDAKGVRGSALGKGPQKNHAAVDLLDAHVAVGNARVILGQVIELVVVGSKEHQGLVRMIVHKFRNGLGDAESVVGGSAAPNLVEQDQAARGEPVEDGCRFGHFDHKGGFASAEVVAGTYAHEDAVQQGQLGLVGSHEAADLRHHGLQRGLPQQRGFARHVGAGEDPNAFAVAA